MDSVTDIERDVRCRGAKNRGVYRGEHLGADYGRCDYIRGGTDGGDNSRGSSGKDYSGENFQPEDTRRGYYSVGSSSKQVTSSRDYCERGESRQESPWSGETDGSSAYNENYLSDSYSPSEYPGSAADLNISIDHTEPDWNHSFHGSDQQLDDLESSLAGGHRAYHSRQQPSGDSQLVGRQKSLCESVSAGESSVRQRVPDPVQSDLQPNRDLSECLRRRSQNSCELGRVGKQRSFDMSNIGRERRHAMNKQRSYDQYQSCELAPMMRQGLCVDNPSLSASDSCVGPVSDSVGRLLDRKSSQDASSGSDLYIGSSGEIFADKRQDQEKRANRRRSCNDILLERQRQVERQARARLNRRRSYNDIASRSRHANSDPMLLKQRSFDALTEHMVWVERWDSRDRCLPASAEFLGDHTTHSSNTSIPGSHPESHWGSQPGSYRGSADRLSSSSRTISGGDSEGRLEDLYSQSTLYESSPDILSPSKQFQNRTKVFSSKEQMKATSMVEISNCDDLKNTSGKCLTKTKRGMSGSTGSEGFAKMKRVWSSSTFSDQGEIKLEGVQDVRRPAPRLVCGLSLSRQDRIDYDDDDLPELMLRQDSPEDQNTSSVRSSSSQSYRGSHKKKKGPVNPSEHLADKEVEFFSRRRHSSASSLTSYKTQGQKRRRTVHVPTHFHQHCVDSGIGSDTGSPLEPRTLELRPQEHVEKQSGDCGTRHVAGETHSSRSDKKRMSLSSLKEVGLQIGSPDSRSAFRRHRSMSQFDVPGASWRGTEQKQGNQWTQGAMSRVDSLPAMYIEDSRRSSLLETTGEEEGETCGQINNIGSMVDKTGSTVIKDTRTSVISHETANVEITDDMDLTFDNENNRGECGPMSTIGSVELVLMETGVPGISETTGGSSGTAQLETNPDDMDLTFEHETASIHHVQHADNFNRPGCLTLDDENKIYENPKTENAKQDKKESDLKNHKTNKKSTDGITEIKQHIAPENVRNYDYLENRETVPCLGKKLNENMKHKDTSVVSPKDDVPERNMPDVPDSNENRENLLSHGNIPDKWEQINLETCDKSSHGHESVRQERVRDGTDTTQRHQPGDRFPEHYGKSGHREMGTHPHSPSYVISKYNISNTLDNNTAADNQGNNVTQDDVHCNYKSQNVTQTNEIVTQYDYEALNFTQSNLDNSDTGSVGSCASTIEERSKSPPLCESVAVDKGRDSSLHQETDQFFQEIDQGKKQICQERERTLLNQGTYTLDQDLKRSKHKVQTRERYDRTSVHQGREEIIQEGDKSSSLHSVTDKVQGISEVRRTESGSQLTEYSIDSWPSTQGRRQEKSPSEGLSKGETGQGREGETVQACLQSETRAGGIDLRPNSRNSSSGEWERGRPALSSGSRARSAASSCHSATDVDKGTDRIQGDTQSTSCACPQTPRVSLLSHPAAVNPDRETGVSKETASQQYPASPVHPKTSPLSQLTSPVSPLASPLSTLTSSLSTLTSPLSTLTVSGDSGTGDDVNIDLSRPQLCEKGNTLINPRPGGRCLNNTVSCTSRESHSILQRERKASTQNYSVGVGTRCTEVVESQTAGDCGSSDSEARCLKSVGSQTSIDCNTIENNQKHKCLESTGSQTCLDAELVRSPSENRPEVKCLENTGSQTCLDAELESIISDNRPYGTQSQTNLNFCDSRHQSCETEISGTDRSTGDRDNRSVESETPDSNERTDCLKTDRYFQTYLESDQPQKDATLTTSAQTGNKDDDNQTPDQQTAISPQVLAQSAGSHTGESSYALTSHTQAAGSHTGESGYALTSHAAKGVRDCHKHKEPSICQQSPQTRSSRGNATGEVSRSKNSLSRNETLGHKQSTDFDHGKQIKGDTRRDLETGLLVQAHGKIHEIDNQSGNSDRRSIESRKDPNERYSGYGVIPHEEGNKRYGSQSKANQWDTNQDYRGKSLSCHSNKENINSNLGNREDRVTNTKENSHNTYTKHKEKIFIEQEETGHSETKREADKYVHSKHHTAKEREQRRSEVSQSGQRDSRGVRRTEREPVSSSCDLTYSEDKECASNSQLDRRHHRTQKSGHNRESGHKSGTTQAISRNQAFQHTPSKTEGDVHSENIIKVSRRLSSANLETSQHHSVSEGVKHLDSRSEQSGTYSDKSQTIPPSPGAVDDSCGHFYKSKRRPSDIQLPECLTHDSREKLLSTRGTEQSTAHPPNHLSHSNQTRPTDRQDQSEQTNRPIDRQDPSEQTNRPIDRQDPSEQTNRQRERQDRLDQKRSRDRQNTSEQTNKPRDRQDLSDQTNRPRDRQDLSDQTNRPRDRQDLSDQTNRPRDRQDLSDQTNRPRDRQDRSDQTNRPRDRQDRSDQTNRPRDRQDQPSGRCEETSRHKEQPTGQPVYRVVDTQDNVKQYQADRPRDRQDQQIHRGVDRQTPKTNKGVDRQNPQTHTGVDRTDRQTNRGVDRPDQETHRGVDRHLDPARQDKTGRAPISMDALEGPGQEDEVFYDEEPRGQLVPVNRYHDRGQGHTMPSGQGQGQRMYRQDQIISSVHDEHGRLVSHGVHGPHVSHGQHVLHGPHVSHGSHHTVRADVHVTAHVPHKAQTKRGQFAGVTVGHSKYKQKPKYPLSRVQYDSPVSSKDYLENSDSLYPMRENYGIQGSHDVAVLTSPDFLQASGPMRAPLARHEAHPSRSQVARADGPVSLHDPVDSMSSQDGHSEAKTGASSNQMHSSSANHSQASHASTNHSHSAAANDTQVNGNVVEDRKNLKNLPIEEVMVKVRAVVEELGRLEDYHRGEGMRLQKMLGDFYWDYTAQRQQIGDAIADAGYAEITIKMLKSLNTIGIFKNDDVWFPAYYTYNTTWNYSDTSDCLAKNLAEADAVRLLTLNCSHKPYLTNIHSKNVYYVMKASMSILHNIARNPNVKSFFKENKTAEVVMPFINMNDDMLRVLAMLTLAYIVEEEDNSKLIDETGTIKNVVMWIGKALDNPKRRFKGFTPQELTQGLDKLAVNDGNKPKIVEEGSIELFMKMLTSDNEKEQSTTARCVWTLAFDKDVRQQLQDTENLMTTLEKLADSQVQDVKKNAQGALWVLTGKGDAPSDRPRSAPRGKNHVFISYSWNEQDRVMEIRDRLRAEGYVVWVDIEQMGGSTLQAMAEAVENAAVVLVCMSEKYKQSPNCRTEAEYTFQLRKDYIPLMMQKKYRPDGWLGMILGAKLFFDFSGKYPFEKSASGLLKELRGRGKRSNVLQGQSVDDVDTLQAREDNQLVQAGNPHRNTHPGTELALHPGHGGHQPQAALMTRDDVQRWLVTQHLDRSIATFSQFDGRLLWQLREMKHEAPEYFYQCLERKLNLDLVDTLRLASALDTLH